MRYDFNCPGILVFFKGVVTEAHLQIEGKVVAVLVGEFAEVFEAYGILEHITVLADESLVL